MMIEEGMQVYKNKEEKKPTIETMQDFTTATAFESKLSMNVHTGTHVDAPLHMLEGGETIETIPLEDLIGPARVLDLTDVTDGITKADLEQWDIQEGEWLLLKTKNSFSDEFDFEFIFVKEDGAEYLKEKKIKGVGIDGLGIERSQTGHPTHKTLFKSGIIIVEGLRLKDVPAGSYNMVIAPLKMQGIDAAPARAILMT